MGVVFIRPHPFMFSRVIILSTSVLNYCLILGVSMVLISLIFRVHPSNDPDVILAMCYVSCVMEFVVEIWERCS